MQSYVSMQVYNVNVSTWVTKRGTKGTSLPRWFFMHVSCILHCIKKYL